MSQAFQFSKFQTNGRINGVKLSLDSTVRDFLKHVAVGRINGWPHWRETFFCKEMHDCFAGPKKSDRNYEVTVLLRWL